MTFCYKLYKLALECFTNLTHATTKFDTVVILWEGFDTNMFEDVTHNSLSSHTTASLSALSLPVSSSNKNGGDDMTAWWSDWIPHTAQALDVFMLDK